MTSPLDDLRDAPADDAVVSAFPDAPRREKGYDRAAVDGFLARARVAFEDDDPALSSADVRSAAFPLVRHGYAVAPVDAALGRVEDAFAARERERTLAVDGTAAYVAEVRTDAQVVLDRLARAKGQRFDRVSALRYGYRVDEVDLVADKLAAFLADGGPVTVDQVRAVAFRMQRGGYRESQVDAVLDAIVEVMLAVT